MTADVDSKIIKKLAKLEKEEGGLPPLLQFYRDLLLVQIETRSRISVPKGGLPGKATQKKTQQELPLLSFDKLKIDYPLARDLFAKIIGIFSSYPELFGEIPEELKENPGHLLTVEVVKAWFDRQELPPAIPDGINEALMQTILNCTLKPFLKAHAGALIPSVDQANWRRRYCPICGGSPDLAFLDKERGARWLLCSRCDSEWLFQRLECPYCGIQDQSALNFYSDDEELYRLYVCKQCKCYLKAIDLRKTEAEVLVPLERLYTLDLDKQAREYGYSPG